MTDVTATYHLQVLLHVTTDGGMLCGVRRPALADAFIEVGSLHRAGDPYEVEASSPEQALERLYRDANIGAEGDWVRTYRERDRSRSLSVGDIVIVNGEAGYQCLSMGWAPITREMAAELPGLIRDGETWIDRVDAIDAAA